MALRAGYYGVKRFLRDKLETIVRTYDETIESLFPRSEQAMLGAYNILPTGNVSYNDYGIVVSTDSNGIVTVTGTLASDAPVIYKVYISNYKLPVGRYKMVGCPPNGANNLQNQLLEVKNGSTVVNSYTDIGEGVEFEITDPSHTISVYVPRLGNGLRGQACNFVYKPMITTDLNASYDDFVPYAMTNKELTDSASDQKTAINAIITAATGAADFAAFKTAMGAITPVTRSLSLTKADITEEVKEDVEPEKTVTKKRATKKTEEV